MHLFRAKGARRWRDFERRKYHVRSALRNPARRTVCLCLLTVQCKILGTLSAIRGIEISAAAHDMVAIVRWWARNQTGV